MPAAPGPPGRPSPGPAAKAAALIEARKVGALVSERQVDENAKPQNTEPAANGASFSEPGMNKDLTAAWAPKKQQQDDEMAAPSDDQERRAVQKRLARRVEDDRKSKGLMTGRSDVRSARNTARDGSQTPKSTWRARASGYTSPHIHPCPCWACYMCTCYAIHRTLIYPSSACALLVLLQAFLSLTSSLPHLTCRRYLSSRGLISSRSAGGTARSMLSTSRSMMTTARSDMYTERYTDLTSGVGDQGSHRARTQLPTALPLHLVPSLFALRRATRCATCVPAPITAFRAHYYGVCTPVCAVCVVDSLARRSRRRVPSRSLATASASRRVPTATSDREAATLKARLLSSHSLLLLACP